MEKIESRARRMGFTMLEVVVVMGIIGILLTIMMPLLSGTRNSALTAQCKNNMKSLALGAIAYAQGNSHGPGSFAAAGFYRSIDQKTSIPGRRRPGKGLSYYPHRSWISNFGSVNDLNDSKSSPIIGDVVCFTDANDDRLRRAITNGAIWKASGESYETYRCPVHARAFQKTNDGRLPGWSYMMNQEFGFNREGKGVMSFFGSNVGGNITVSTDSSAAVDKGMKRKQSASRSPDKVLMFAEVQGVDVSEKGVSLKAVRSSSETDAVLEYPNESMGFNHPMGKGRYGGNVAFADGHVDTVILPIGTSPRDITRYLCQGFEIPHDGSKYTPPDLN